MPKITFAVSFAVFLSVLPVVADDARPSPAQTKLVVDAFPLGGPAENLEPEVLDFRYQPGRWQACIGLPDDAYKTIVGSDGGLYYEYGKRGPEPYDNGQGSFGTRVLAELQVEGEPRPCRQSLQDPRIPIVMTERERGDWLLHQEAWSAALHGDGQGHRRQPAAWHHGGSHPGPRLRVLHPPHPHQPRRPPEGAGPGPRDRLRGGRP